MTSELSMLFFFFADTILTTGERGGPRSFKPRGGDTNGGGTRSTAARRRRTTSEWRWKASRWPARTLASGRRSSRRALRRTRCEASNGYGACGRRSSRESKTFPNLPIPTSRPTKNQNPNHRGETSTHMLR